MTAASIAATDRSAGAGARTPRRRAVGWLGFALFAAYILLFLVLPTLLAVWSGLTTADGRFPL
ncbi:MAG: ABC transporter permease, partial [Leifsonia sp.]